MIVNAVVIVDHAAVTCVEQQHFATVVVAVLTVVDVSVADGDVLDTEYVVAVAVD